MPEFNVYEEWDRRLVASAHGPDITYRVIVGTVNWDRSATGLRPAITVLMQYGSQINYQMPAHILREDTQAVLQAIEELRPQLT